MNDSKILPADPKLTAYALGELEGDERAHFEARLRRDPAAQVLVEEIRAAVTQLQAALDAEEDAAPISLPLNFPRKVGSSNRASPTRLRQPRRLGKMLSFPQVYYVIGGLAAACFALVVALRPPAPQQTHVAKPRPAPAPVVQAVPVVQQAPTPVVPDEPVEVSKAAAAVAAYQEPGNPAAQAAPALKSIGELVLPKSDLSLLATAQHALLTPSEPEVKSLLPSMPALSAKMSDSYFDNYATASAVERRERSPAWEDTKQVEYAQYRRDPRSVLPQVRHVSSAPVKPRVYRLAGNGKPGSSGILSELRDMSATVARKSPQFISDVPEEPISTVSRDRYAHRDENGFLTVSDHPLSTFSADVDTASYANVRRLLTSGARPPTDALRIEELINYFPNRSAPPAGEAPFAATMEVSDAPWAPAHRLVRIALKGREVTTSQRGAANLVFLLDVSGSMNAPNRLPLVKESMRLLLARLRADDHVAIVTYAGASGLALPSTPVSKAREIVAALDELTPSGPTNGSMGIHLAYDIAKANFVTDGINRVILCTDGDFNVGVTNDTALNALVAEKARSGVFLTVLGFGMGNLQDGKLHQLADAGNGEYGYVDTRREAEKLLVEQVSGTLVTIAKDVKLQVEFNPAEVAGYRLIGYEKRLLEKEDFNNDAVDAGEIGAGHTVTALYEIVPAAGVTSTAAVHENVKAGEQTLKYAAPADPAEQQTNSAARQRSELLTLKIRYKDPTGDFSKVLEFPLVDEGTHFTAASQDFKFAAAVAGFGMKLQDSPYRGSLTWAEVLDWAEAGAGADPGGYRAEFIGLVKQAESLIEQPTGNSGGGVR